MQELLKVLKSKVLSGSCGRESCLAPGLYLCNWSTESTSSPSKSGYHYRKGFEADTNLWPRKWILWSWSWPRRLQATAVTVATGATCQCSRAQKEGESPKCKKLNKTVKKLHHLNLNFSAWRPSLVAWRPSLSGWRPSLSGWPTVGPSSVLTAGLKISSSPGE